MLPFTPEELKRWQAIPVAELAERSSIQLTVLPTVADVHRHFAQEMLDEISAAAQAAQRLALIVPVGPTGQYPLLAEMVNERKLSLEHVTLYGMDEWLDWEGRPLPLEHPFSLEGRFRSSFLDRLDPGLAPPPEQILFPSPFRLGEEHPALSGELAVATTYGGFGYQGHVAFNEPPSTRWTPISLQQLRNSRTRVLPLAIDTIIAHSQRSLGGNTFGIPPMAVTLGMSELLSAGRVRLYTDGGAWKQTILRILLFSQPTVEYPLTLTSDHADLAVVVDAASAACPPVDW